MILDISKLKKGQVSQALVFEYPLTFNDKLQYGNIVIEGTGTNRTIQVYISDLSVLSDTNAIPTGEVVETNDIKIAWEKFEDLFNASDEGQAQKPEEPEVTNMFVTFNSTGEAKLFLQNLKNEQQVIYEFTIDDLELKSKRPLSFVLDYTDDDNMPEQLRAKWYMSNTNGEVTLEGTTSDYSTYQVAVVSVAPPNSQNNPQHGGQQGGGQQGGGQQGGGQQGGQHGGSGTGGSGTGGSGTGGSGTGGSGTGGTGADGTGASSGTKDEGSGTSDDRSDKTYSVIVQTIANISGFSQRKVEASLRDEENFRDFIEINDVNWKEISQQLGLSKDFYEFTSQVINIVENN